MLRRHQRRWTPTRERPRLNFSHPLVQGQRVHFAFPERTVATAGRLFTDLTGRGNHCVLASGDLYSVKTAQSYDGRGAHHYATNVATGNYASIAATSQLFFDAAAESFTVSAWISNLAGAGSAYRTIHVENDSGYPISGQGTSSLNYHQYDGSTLRSLAVGTAYNDALAHMHTIVSTPARATLYIDAVQVATSTTTLLDSGAGAQPWILGNREVSAANRPMGDAGIWGFVVWPRELKVGEVRELYRRWWDQYEQTASKTIFIPAAAATAPDRTTGAEFDGTADYLTRGADLTGAADGKQGTVAFWYKRGATTSFQYLLSNDNVRFVVAQNTADEIEFRARNGSGTLILQGYTNTDPPLDEWVHVMASWDLATTTLHVYRNGLSDLKAAPTVTNDTIDYTGGNFIVGAGNSSGASKLTGCLAEVWFDDVYVDLSDSANRAKFYVSGAQPPDLGSDGSTPTGGAPLLYLSGGASQFEDNFGTGGAFTVNGALVDCPLPTFLATNLASLTISELGQATGHGTALASDTITELGQATGLGTALASDTITEHGQAEGVITALDALTKAGHSAAFGAAIATVLASLTKQGQGALLGLVSALDSLSILERGQALGLITSTASKTITEHTAGISTGAGGAVSTNLASLTKLGLAAGVTVWEIGDALAAAYDDLPEYFAAGELVDADLAAYLDNEMGFAETVTVGASEIAGIFDDHSTAGGAVDGPRLVVKTSDVTAQAIDQGSVLTIRGRTFHVWGVQRDGVGVSTLVLREPS